MVMPSLGCRVRILKDYATVRYIGPVAKQEGTWVGVEWDDPSRGKHDGSSGGIRYFECKSGGNAGSFVRIERVCFGVSMLDALRARYNNETAEHGEEVAEDELYVHTSRNRRVKVQLIGEEKIQQKQRQIHAMESARLVGLDVSSVDPPSLLASSLPALTSLDLTCNLLADWTMVEALAAGLPHLSALNVSENRISMSQTHACAALGGAVTQTGDMTVTGTASAAGEVASSEQRQQEQQTAPAPAHVAAAPLLPLPGLRVLVLNDCGISWHDILRVAPQLPSLEELHCCGNHIPSLAPPASGLRAASARSCGGAPPQGAPPQGASQQQQPAGAACEAAEADPQRQGHQDSGDSEEGACGGCSNSSSSSSSSSGHKGGASGGGGSDRGCGSGSGGAAVEEEEEDGGHGEAAAELLASLFPRLQVLTLEEVRLGGWPTLELLRRLPALTRLHLGGNTQLTHVRYPPHCNPPAAAAATAPAPAATACTSAAPASSPPACSVGVDASSSSAPSPGLDSSCSPPAPGVSSFPRLTALFLGGCGIADWGSVDQLDSFPELKEVRLTGNPVLAMSRTGGRFEVIGRVSRLRHLNGAEVRPRERRDSELRYLQHIAAEMEAAGGDEAKRAAVRASHPRLRALMEVYGTVLATASRGGPGGPGGSLAASMVELKLTCVAAAAHAKMGSQVKKLPRSTTVSALRLLCEKLFKVPSDRMSLFLRAPGDPLPEDLGGPDLEDRPLAFFGVQAGYEVLVDEVEAGQQRREQRAAQQQAAAAHEQRLAEQLRTADRMQAEFARNMGVQQQQQQQQQQ